MSLRPLLLALLLTGCEVGPDYRPPHPTLPANWTESRVTPAQAAATAAGLKAWWTGFHDPVLNGLIADAIAGNLSLQVARQRIVSARAERIVAGAADYPQIGFSSTDTIDNSSTTLQYPPGIGEYRSYAFGFDARWELDVFGGTRRAEEAAAAQVQALEEDRRGALVSLIAELAGDYAALRATEARIGIATRNVDTARRLLDLTNTEFARGLTTSLAVAQAGAQLQTATATLPPLRAGAAQLTHAIAVLTGRFPGELEARLLVPAPVVPTPPTLPLSLPSEVVANRPDIRQAERRLAVSSARIGAAVAELYPHFSIPLLLMPTTSYLSETFQAASLAWSAGLALTQTVYQGGRLSARVTEARAAAEADRLSYRQTVLTAFREVEDALAAYQTEVARQAALGAAAAESRTALDRAQRLYGAGLTDFLNLLSAERALYAAEDAAALSDLARVRDLIALYKALGGGWQGVSFGDEAHPSGARPAPKSGAAIARPAADVG